MVGPELGYYVRVETCFRELTLQKSNLACWLSTKWALLSSPRMKLVLSDIDEIQYYPS
jgi:hypothetical protein